MELTHIVEGLIAIIVMIVGWQNRVIFGKLNKHEEKHDKLSDATNQLRADMHKELSDAHRHSEQCTEKLRDEINQLSTSLRAEITASSTLSANNTQTLLQAIEKLNV